MLADLLPLRTDSVQHWYPPDRDVFGQVTATIGFTEHAARILYSPGDVLAVASRQAITDANALVWLIDHPRPIAIGDTFKLPSGEALKVRRVERRPLAGNTLSKVYLT